MGGGIAAGDKYLNEGTLYVAKFNDTGNGEWLELSFNNASIKSFSKDGFTFANQADVLVHTRFAADAVGATPMDRPEWGALTPGADLAGGELDVKVLSREHGPTPL